MTRFHEPDLTVDPNSPFLRDASNKLVRRSYWMDMPDQALVMVMTKGSAQISPTMKRERT
jgi:hypothetical protein